MSVITNVVVIFAHDNDGAIELIKAFPHRLDEGLSFDLCKIDFGQAGGTKVFTGDVWAGAFNHLDIDAFEAYVKKIVWPSYRTPVILVQHEYRDEEQYRVIKLFK